MLIYSKLYKTTHLRRLFCRAGLLFSPGHFGGEHGVAVAIPGPMLCHAEAGLPGDGVYVWGEDELGVCVQEGIDHVLVFRLEHGAGGVDQGASGLDGGGGGLQDLPLEA